ncbi:MAG: hypothetical protein EXR72_04270 [Myxococcales bacterium]|nr:hypothetical protein [Myxococcales bacterium]
MKRFAALALLLVSATARAQQIDETGRDYSSPQHFAVELKFGPYSPNIDSTPGLKGKTPFRDLFTAQDNKDAPGRPPGKVLTTLEFDWQVWHGFGSFGLAASAGISRRSTHSFVYDRPGGVLSSCATAADLTGCDRSSDQTALNVMPFALQLVYRFDYLAVRYKVPVVPYLKGGVAYYLWWIENGAGEVTRTIDKTTKMSDTSQTCGFGGDCGLGGTFGLVAHPGVALLLDVLDPGSARTMDSELGINHSYLFAELHYAWINGFNSPTKMVFSDVTWNMGLAFEF